MKIPFGGIQKTSMIDFPGRIACVLFVSGCNFRCPYCHNPELVRGTAEPLDWRDIRDFLQERKGWLDGVVISGGEPTIFDGLPEICAALREMGYAVKLDTNGSRAEMVSALIEEKRVDYIAMDIKTAPNRYFPDIWPGASAEAASEAIRASVRAVVDSGVEHEFRTTCVRPFVDESAFVEIGPLVRGARRYALQEFRPRTVLVPDFFQRDDASAVAPDEMAIFKDILAPFVEKIVVR